MFGKQHTVVRVVTELRAGRSDVPISAVTRHLSLLQIVQTCCEANTVCHLIGDRLISLEAKRP